MGDLGFGILCGNHDMSCRRDISLFIFLRLTIEIKLEAVFLHAIDPIEADRDRFVRKSLNAFRNGTRGLRGIDDGRSQTNDGSDAYNHGERRNAAQQTESGAGKCTSNTERKDSAGRAGRVRSDSPRQTVTDRKGSCGERDKDGQSAENSMSGGEQERKFSFFGAAGG